MGIYNDCLEISWLACEEIFPKWKSDLAEKRTEFYWEIKNKTYKGILAQRR